MPPKLTQQSEANQIGSVRQEDGTVSSSASTRLRSLSSSQSQDQSSPRGTRYDTDDVSATNTVPASAAGSVFLPAAAPTVRFCPASWSDLPSELQLNVLEGLSATELLAYTAPGSPFKQVIEDNRGVRCFDADPKQEARTACFDTRVRLPGVLLV